MNSPNISPAVLPERRRSFTSRILAVLALTGTVLLAPKLYDVVNGPDFSGQQTVTIQPGDTVFGLIEEKITGSENVDNMAIYLKIRNNSPDLNDGSADAGDLLNMPKSVEP